MSGKSIAAAFLSCLALLVVAAALELPDAVVGIDMAALVVTGLALVIKTDDTTVPMRELLFEGAETEGDDTPTAAVAEPAVLEQATA